MVRPRHLFIASVFVCAVVTGQLLVTPAFGASCSTQTSKAGVCTSGNIVGGGVNVTGQSRQTGGASSQSTSGQSTSGQSTSGQSTTSAGKYSPNNSGVRPSASSGRFSSSGYTNHIFSDCRELGASGRKCSSKPSSSGTQQSQVTFVEDEFYEVTIEDISRFVPQPVSVVTQPSPWTVINLPTNVIGSARTHIVSGSLFGDPAEVRFTPIRYNWSYGDGASKTTTTLGARWEQLGVTEFSETATSHVYRQLGSYTISLLVYYTAEYRYLGGPWIKISGELSAPADTAVLTAYNAQTVLAAEDCRSRPLAPGC